MSIWKNHSKKKTKTCTIRAVRTIAIAINSTLITCKATLRITRLRKATTAQSSWPSTTSCRRSALLRKRESLSSKLLSNAWMSAPSRLLSLTEELMIVSMAFSLSMAMSRTSHRKLMEVDRGIIKWGIEALVVLARNPSTTAIPCIPVWMQRITSE